MSLENIAIISFIVLCSLGGLVLLCMVVSDVFEVVDKIKERSEKRKGGDA